MYEDILNACGRNEACRGPEKVGGRGSGSLDTEATQKGERFLCRKCKQQIVLGEEWVVCTSIASPKDQEQYDDRARSEISPLTAFRERE